MPSLRHLHIDTRNSTATMSHIRLWIGILDYTKRSKARIESLIFQMSEQVYIDSRITDFIMETHPETLTTFRLVNCAISSDVLRRMCVECTKLEVVSLPMNTRKVVCVLYSLVLRHLSLI